MIENFINRNLKTIMVNSILVTIVIIVLQQKPTSTISAIVLLFCGIFGSTIGAILFDIIFSNKQH